MKTLYDVQQLLKQFGVVVYLGKRLYDIEMMKIELEALYKSALIDKENYLNEDTLNQGDNSFYDYCADISDEERKEEITNLVNSILPKGMFELVSEDTIRYTGDGMEQWKEKYVAEIRKKADAITVENMFEWSSTYYLKQAIDNPLDTGYHFYLNGDGCQSFAEPSFEFMLFVSSLEPGTLLYVGGVIDYHF